MADQRRQDAASEEVPSAAPAHTEVLDQHVCWDLLRKVAFGRLAVVVDGEPDVFPVNYVVDHGTIVFRTDTGRKLSAAAGRPVAFEVDGHDPGYAVVWSVVVRGVGAEIREMDEVIEAMELPLTPWQEGRKARFIRIRPSAVTGRRVHLQDRPVPSAH
jgi:nitroimidazol reductase NimA-like FMN-containing flavoprotein (pyridoxamine 5'-phosphate oxidase superfamily)